MSDSEIYTVTMARVYAGQGYYEKAAQIYRHLIYQDGRNEPELISALAAVEQKRDASQGEPKVRLHDLFAEMIDLILRQNNVRKLKKL
jgi:hypothetical protein